MSSRDILVYVVFGLIILFCGVVIRGAPYVPSMRRYLRRIFRELYPISSKDVLVDLGSGDGVVLREAAKCGARAIGYEVNPILALVARALSVGDGRVSTRIRDFWMTHLPNDVTVVYAFIVERDMPKLRDYLQRESDRIGRTLIVISHGFEFKDLQAEKSLLAYRLYRFHPLHKKQP